jgi:hypothetical protein
MAWFASGATTYPPKPRSPEALPHGSAPQWNWTARASSSKGSAGAASGTPLCLAQAIPLLTVTHLQLVPAENR